MTRIKYLVLALATATAGAAPPSLRGLKDASGAETSGDAFELPLAKAVAENDAIVAKKRTWYNLHSLFPRRRVPGPQQQIGNQPHEGHVTES